MTTALNIRFAQRPLSREWHSCVQPQPATAGGVDRGMERLAAMFTMNRAPKQGHEFEQRSNAIWERLRM